MTSLVLSDGTGASLLSRSLHRCGEPLPYRPELRITHTGSSLREQFRTWNRDMARNAIDIRHADPTMPLTSALHWGPLAALPIGAGRWIHGLKKMAGARHDLGVGPMELILDAVLFAALMTAYTLGLLRELQRRARPDGPDVSD